MLKIGDRCEWWHAGKKMWYDNYGDENTYYLCKLPKRFKKQGYKYLVISNISQVIHVKDVRPYSKSNKKLSELEEKQRYLAKQQVELADEIAKLKGE